MAPATDVAAALTVVATRNTAHDLHPQSIDLDHAHLANSQLQQARLAGANLSAADLTNADLTGASLVDANLTSADVAGADFTNAHLAGALWPLHIPLPKGWVRAPRDGSLKRAGT